MRTSKGALFVIRSGGQKTSMWEDMVLQFIISFFVMKKKIYLCDAFSHSIVLRVKWWISMFIVFEIPISLQQDIKYLDNLISHWLTNEPRGEKQQAHRARSFSKRKSVCGHEVEIGPRWPWEVGIGTEGCRKKENLSGSEEKCWIRDKEREHC